MKDFATEAERRRRAGDAHAAVEIAEAGLAQAPANDRARMALALALLDLGDLPRARQRLEMAFAALPPPIPTTAHFSMPAEPEPTALGSDLGDDELESAFAAAETNPDEMMSANRVVEQTLENEHVEAPEAGFDVTGSATYATETMASLLEEQGRMGEAEVLRHSLATPELALLDDSDNDSTLGGIDTSGALEAAEAFAAPAAGWAEAGVGPDHAERLRIVATLESWLYNLRQNAERDSRARTAGRPSPL